MFGISAFSEAPFSGLPGTSVRVFVTGVAASGEIGFVVVTGDANAPVTGVSAAGQVGSVTVVAKAVVDATGVSATGFVGSVVVTADAVVVTTGVQATGQIGNANVLIVVPVTGVQGTTALGTITLESNNYLDVTGFGMVGSVGLVDVYGTATPGDDTREVDFRRYHTPLDDIEAQQGAAFLDKCYAWVMSQPDMTGSVAV